MWKLIGNQLNVMWKLNSLGRQRERSPWEFILRGRFAIDYGHAASAFFSHPISALNTFDVSIKAIFSGRVKFFDRSWCWTQVLTFLFVNQKQWLTAKWNIRLITDFASKRETKKSFSCLTTRNENGRNYESRFHYHNNVSILCRNITPEKEKENKVSWDCLRTIKSRQEWSAQKKELFRCEN